MKIIISMGSIAVGFILTYLWVILPKERFLKWFGDSSFPFLDFTISARFYAEYVMARLFFIILTAVIHFNVKVPESKIALFLMIGYLLDFCLVYNQPYAYLFEGKFVRTKPENGFDGFYIPISYALVLGISLIILTVISWIKY
jgi:hypothetical protein